MVCQVVITKRWHQELSDNVCQVVIAKLQSQGGGFERRHSPKCGESEAGTVVKSAPGETRDAAYEPQRGS